MRSLIRFTLIWVLAQVASLSAADSSKHIVIITAKSSGLTSLPLSELQKLFKAEKTKAPDGSKVVVVAQEPGTPAREIALRTLYGMSEAEYTKYFLQATFTGKLQAAPKMLAPGAVKKYVAETPGAIGYVLSTDADDSVRVIKVDDKTPFHADYPL